MSLVATTKDKAFKSFLFTGGFFIVWYWYWLMTATHDDDGDGDANWPVCDVNSSFYIKNDVTNLGHCHQKKKDNAVIMI